MSFVDDCEEELIIERAIFANTVETCNKIYSDNKVIWDAINSFKYVKVDESSELECMTREILKTVARLKRISDKQKMVLIRMLINRSEKGYELKERI